MIRYFLYVRKSTESEERQVLSLESQASECKKFAENEKLKIVNIFTESKTAKKIGRPVFNEMIERIEQGEADGIISWHPDRLARNSVDGGRIIYLIDTGKLKSIKSPTFWLDNTPQGKFMLNIAFGQSKYYVDNLSENVKRGEFPGLAPLGYYNDPKTRTIELNEDKYKIIRKAFKLYSSGGYSLNDINLFLNKHGFTGRTGNRIYKSSIESLLKNPFYYGMIKWNGEMFEGIHKPIISKELFDKVQTVIKHRGRKRKEKHHFTLRGYMICGECGAAITASIHKKNNYYHCTKRKKKCLQPYVREESLSEQLFEQLKGVTINRSTYDYLISELKSMKDKEDNYISDTRAELKTDLKGIEKTLNKLLDTYLDGLLEKEEYQVKREQLLNKKADIKAHLDKIRRNPDFRFELAKDLFFDCFSVDKIISERNLPAGNTFLKKSGLNHILKEKTLSFSWAIPYNYIAEGNRKIKIIVNNYRRDIKEPHFSGQDSISLLDQAGTHYSDTKTELISSVRSVWSG